MKRALKYAVPFAALIAQGIDEPADAGDLFLKIEGVEGESIDPQHAGEIDVLAWSWGVANSGTTHGGTGSGAGKVNIGDIKIIKSVDSATNELLAAAATGQHFGDATLYVTRPDTKGGNIEIMEIFMDTVLVTKLAHGARESEAGVAETVTLNFAKVEMKYRKVKGDGSPDAWQEMCWDIVQNVGC